MTDLPDLFPAEPARADLQGMAIARARNCVRFAVVTSEPIAADLIDRAVALRAAAERIAAAG